MKKVPVNPADILAYKIDRDDVKRFAKNYAKWLTMYLVLLFMFILFNRMADDPSTSRSLNLFIIFITLLFAGCFIHYGRVIYISRARYRKDIEKYGAQVLTTDLSKPDNEVYYLDRNKTETYMIISDTFLYFSHTRIFAWNEILKIYINPEGIHYLNSLDLNLSGNAGSKPYNPNSKNPKEMVRFFKHARILLKNGKTVECLVALEDEQLRAFMAALSVRSHGRVPVREPA
jgi:hypothetical protein